MLQDELQQQRDRIYPAALICSVIANVHRDPDRKREPWQPAQFMPGAKSEEEEWREFLEAIESGKPFETDPEEMEHFKHMMQSTFRNLVVQKPGEIVRTNAIAGEKPGRGVN